MAGGAADPGTVLEWVMAGFGAQGAALGAWMVLVGYGGTGECCQLPPAQGGLALGTLLGVPGGLSPGRCPPQLLLAPHRSCGPCPLSLLLGTGLGSVPLSLPINSSFPGNPKTDGEGRGANYRVDAGARRGAGCNPSATSKGPSRGRAAPQGGRHPGVGDTQRWETPKGGRHPGVPVPGAAPRPLRLPPHPQRGLPGRRGRWGRAEAPRPRWGGGCSPVPPPRGRSRLRPAPSPLLISAPPGGCAHCLSAPSGAAAAGWAPHHGQPGLQGGQGGGGSPSGRPRRRYRALQSQRAGGYRDGGNREGTGREAPCAPDAQTKAVAAARRGGGG